MFKDSALIIYTNYLNDAMNLRDFCYTEARSKVETAIRPNNTPTKGPKMLWSLRARYSGTPSETTESHQGVNVSC
jgi:hypothetical protein